MTKRMLHENITTSINNKYSEFERSCFPLNFKGVYGIFIKSYFLDNTRCLYIGSAKNIEKRTLSKNHPYKYLLDRFTKQIVARMFIETDNYIELEKELIRKYKPLLNKRRYLCL